MTAAAVDYGQDSPPLLSVSGLAVQFGALRAGRILLSGRRVQAEPLSVARRGVAVVWQDLALCDNLDVASNLMLGRERRRHLLSDTRFHAAAAAMLDELSIPLDDTTRGARALSGGQRQL